LGASLQDQVVNEMGAEECLQFYSLKLVHE
jgi:hypothetical protein